MISAASQARALTFLDETRQLHAALVRREGHPGEVRKQARFLLIENAEYLTKQTVPATRLASFATHASALYRGSDVTLDLPQQRIVAELFQQAVDRQDPELGCATRADARRLLARTTEFAQAFLRDSPELFTPLLTLTYTKGVDAVVTSPMDKYAAGDTIPLLSAASDLYAPSFEFRRAGVGAAMLLPRKLKLQMEAKLQRCTGASKLLIAARDMPLTMIDSIRMLTTLAECGFYDATVVHNCCESFDRTIAAAVPRDVARVTYGLGVLGHRYPTLADLCQHFDGRKVSPREFSLFLQGLGMHQVPLSRLRMDQSVADGAFLHGMRKDAPFNWHVDVVHALAAVNCFFPKFTVHVCRSVMNSIHKMEPEAWLKLLFAVRSKSDWNDQIEGLETSWTKVDRVRDILVAKIQATPLTPQLTPIAAEALRAAGYAPNLDAVRGSRSTEPLDT
jgi:hypothetical protein